MSKTTLVDLVTQFSGFLFDMDGLLIDTERLSFEAWSQASKERGFTLTRKIFGTVVGTTAEESHRRLRLALGEGFPAEELRRRRTELFETRIEREGIPLLPGAHRLIVELRQAGKKLGLVTSTRNPFASERIKRAGLFGLFDIMVTGSDVERLKPAPDLYARAAHLLQMPLQECIAFEDSGLGVEAASGAGIEVIMVPNLYSPNEIDLNRARVVLNSLEDLFL